MKYLLLILSLLPITAHAQIEPDAEARAAGYVHSGDTTYFLFDEALYDAEETERVVVTGAFRGWSQDMEEAAWRLRPSQQIDGLWTLSVYNPEYDAVAPGTPFKFRIDEGTWLSPPETATNQEGGNLVFLFGAAPPRLRAELHGPRAVTARLTGDDVPRPLDASAYRLVTPHGDEIAVSEVLPRTAEELLVVPAEELDVRRVYYLEMPGHDFRALARRDGWFRTLYSHKPLGAEIAEDGSRTTFRLFAPRADSVHLYLYDDAGATPEQARQIVSMTRDDDGVWEAEREGDLHGTYYDFRLYGPQDPGNEFFETTGAHVSDPYARVSMDSWGKSRVWRPTRPASPLPGGRPAMEDVVAYEVHVQDFTDQLPVSDDLRGTLPAMVQPGLTNEAGEPVGFDYLTSLGINTVHLMPVQEFLHYPDDLWQEHFADDPYMQKHEVARENYQWGYRTTHAFAVEHRFRQKGTEPGTEREQFRDLVQAFHDAGLAVIIDIVPNHTGENMDEAHHVLNFNGIDKPYYYRTDEELEHIGPFGNEVKTEERPMTQRWLIDQARHFVEEFGIDGFRVDLAGQIDQQTLIKMKAELPDDLIIYGEPWIAPSDPDVADNPDWAWYKKDAPITYFQDDARNAFKGDTSNPEDKQTDRGFAGGDASARGDAMHGLTNRYPNEETPNHGINYLDIHDNWALADRFARTNWDGRQGVDEGAFKVAAGLLFTSAGPIVLHGGTEMMRSKGSADLVEIKKDFPLGTLYFHGKRDTYNIRRPNQFVWDNLGQERYDEMLAYWKGLIALRNSEYGEVFRVGERLPEDYYRWILPDDGHLLGYVVDERVFVLVNTGGSVATFDDLRLPAGSWRLVADADEVDHEGGVDGPDAQLTGGALSPITLPAQSLKIWVRD